MTDERATARAEAIRALRGLQNQTDFAKDIGVTRGTVVQLEKGNMPSLRTATALVNLGLDQRLVMPYTSSATGQRGAA